LRILIVGGGGVAEELLSLLDLKKHQVYVVEKDPQRRAELSSKYDIFVIGKDATDVTLYASDIQMDEIDMVIALTGRNEINLFVLAIAKLYNVPYRLAKVTDHRIANLLQELGLGVPISQASLIASILNSYLDSISSPRLISIIGNYKIYQISLAETDPVIGTELRNLKLPEDVKILLLFDGKTLRPPIEDDVLRPGYQLIVLSRVEDVERYFKG